MNGIAAQRIADLRYYLTDRTVCLAPLRVLAQRCVEWQDWHVTMFVLGTSHAVRLDRDGTHITELLTCHHLPCETPALATASIAAPACIEARTHGLHCRVSLEPFALGEGDGLQARCEPAMQMDVAYPALPHDVAPVTRIGWLVEPGSLRIETVHTYPEEGLGVRSRTCFRCEELR